MRAKIQSKIVFNSDIVWVFRSLLSSVCNTKSAEKQKCTINSNWNK